MFLFWSSLINVKKDDGLDHDNHAAKLVFLCLTGVMHEADDADLILSTWSCYWIDQFLTLALNT